MWEVEGRVILSVWVLVAVSKAILKYKAHLIKHDVIFLGDISRWSTDYTLAVPDIFGCKTSFVVDDLV